MKIVVLVKEVPSTEARIELVGGKPNVSGVQAVINPYDEYAVEEAIRLAEAHPGSSTTAVMAGTDASKKNLTNILALGIDEAILIKFEGGTGAGGADTLVCDPLGVA